MLILRCPHFPTERQPRRAFHGCFLWTPGIVEIEDQAAGVRELLKRPYVDQNRVGVFGTSYGGTASAYECEVDGGA